MLNLKYRVSVVFLAGVCTATLLGVNTTIASATSLSDQPSCDMTARQEYVAAEAKTYKQLLTKGGTYSQTVTGSGKTVVHSQSYLMRNDAYLEHFYDKAQGISTTSAIVKRLSYSSFYNENSYSFGFTPTFAALNGSTVKKINANIRRLANNGNAIYYQKSVLVGESPKTFTAESFANTIRQTGDGYNIPTSSLCFTKQNTVNGVQYTDVPTGMRYKVQAGVVVQSLTTSQRFGSVTTNDVRLSLPSIVLPTPKNTIGGIRGTSIMDEAYANVFLADFKDKLSYDLNVQDTPLSVKNIRTLTAKVLTENRSMWTVSATGIPTIRWTLTNTLAGTKVVMTMPVTHKVLTLTVSRTNTGSFVIR